VLERGIAAMLDHPVLFEMLAPSQQGPAYVRMLGDAMVVTIGSEFNLNAAQVQAWIAVLAEAKNHMQRPA
jgi:hypothetical protein